MLDGESRVGDYLQHFRKTARLMNGLDNENLRNLHEERSVLGVENSTVEYDSRHSSGRDRLQHFDPVTKRIVHVDPVVAGQRIVILHGIAEPAQFFREPWQVHDMQCGMRFAGRAKVGLDTEMDLQLAVLKPAATARCERGRLGNFRNSEGIAVERTS